MAVKIGNLYYVLHDHNTDEKVAVVTYPRINDNYISGIVKIPEKVTYNDDDYRICTIGNSAFKNCTELETVILPTTVTKIQSDVFKDCTSLTNIISHTTNLMSVDSNIVYGCTSLQNINFSFNTGSIFEIRGNTFDNSNNCDIYVPYSGDNYLHNRNWQYSENIKNRIIPYKNTDDNNDFGTAIFYGYSNRLFTSQFDKSQITLFKSAIKDTVLQEYTFPNTEYNKYLYFLMPIDLVENTTLYISVKSYNDDDENVNWNTAFKEPLTIIGDYFMDNNIYRYYMVSMKQNKDGNTYIITDNN